jgi:hypothetical protein
MPKHKLGRRDLLRMAAPVPPMAATLRAQAKSFFV